MCDFNKKDLALRVAGHLDQLGTEAVIKPPVLVRTQGEAHALASILREAVEGWQDISSAPKDGTAVMLLARSRIVIGRWSDEAYAKGHPFGSVRPRPLWVTSEGTEGLLGESWDRDNQPTHWMPLPALPEEA